MQRLTFDASHSTPADDETAAAPAKPGAVQLDIEGISVVFPFQPYAVQEDYMRAVIRALQGTQNALLESPTGTGKTLCLLCATLAWVVNERAANPSARPRVLYTSRTHAQLAQVVREFQRTVYSESCTMAILGSREHMCVKPDVRQLPSAHARNSTCNRLRAARECGFGNGVMDYIAQQERERGIGAASSLLDIEDLVKEGRRAKFCPYFYEREIAKTADIVFLPYSYVLDRSLKAQTLELLQGERLILIVDEAHNVASNLSSSASGNLAAADLSAAINEASMCCSKADLELREEGDATRRAELEQAAEHYAILKLIFANLERAIGGIAMQGAAGGGGATKEAVFSGSEIFEFLSRDGIRIGVDTIAEIQKIAAGAISFLAATDSAGRGLAAVQEFLSCVFDTEMSPDEIALVYRFVVLAAPERVRAQFSRGGGGSGNVGAAVERRTLGFWCLDTAVAMRKVAEPFSVILMTSGTLSPMDHFAAELGIEFPVVHQGKHVIGGDQVFCSVLCKGPGGGALNSSYEHRSTVEYRSQLGLAIVNIARNVPGGMLVFFPSYSSMNLAIDFWKAGGAAVEGSGGGSATIWGMLSDVKAIFVEPTDGGELPKLIQAYQQSCEERKGALLLAVARGKIGEGVDFADRHGRCVFVTGIPFANNSDLLVRLKREYLTKVAPTRPRVRGKLFTGDDWYRNEAMRAVNQCIGRVIRHKDDFGAIVLGDERFSGLRDAVSPWVSTALETHQQFRDTYAAVTKFFLYHGQRDPKDGLVNKRARVGDSGVAGGDGARLFMAAANGAQAIPDSAAAARAYVDSDAVRPPAPESQQQQQHQSAFGKVVVLNSDPALVFRRVAVPAVAASPVAGTTAATPAAGAQPAAPSASKQFCEGLRTKLSPESYKSFTEVLRGTARLVASKAEAAEVKERLREHVVTLRKLFEASFPPAEASATLREFGRFIPAAWQHFYATLL